MSAGAEQARNWANDLVASESRGPGDIENAMRRLEHEVQITKLLAGDNADSMAEIEVVEGALANIKTERADK